MLSFDGQYKKCLKCGHQRTAQDTGPEWACPACGAVYAKMEAMAAERAAMDSAQAPLVDEARADARRRFERAARGGARDRDDGDGDARKGVAHAGYLLLAMPILAPFLGGLFRPGVAGAPFLLTVAGVVLAYVQRRDFDHSWVDSHFSWQIRTFWRLVIWSLVPIVPLALIAITTAQRAARHGLADSSIMGLGGMAAAVGILYFVIGLLYLIRVVGGWIKLSRNVPIEA
jgi:uncharacterized membrane protein